MLILTRKINQAIIINGNAWVRVLGVERDRVKLGIEAPREVPVLREELLGRGDDPLPSAPFCMRCGEEGHSIEDCTVDVAILHGSPREEQEERNT